MNLRRLGKQLKRETQAHPVKAAFLVGLLGVGVYSWAPLVAGWISPSETGDNELAAVATGAPTPNVPTPNVATPSTPARARTEEWLDWLAAGRHDPRRSPARWSFGGRDPFAATGRQAEILEHEKQVAQGKLDPSGKNKSPTSVAASQPKPQPVTPKSLGMTLTSTAVTPTRQLALLRGSFIHDNRLKKQILVSEGDTIHAATGKVNQQPVAKLVSQQAAQSARGRGRRCTKASASSIES